MLKGSLGLEKRLQICKRGKQGDQLEAIVVFRAREDSAWTRLAEVMRETVFAEVPGFPGGCGTWESRVRDDFRVSQRWGIKDCLQKSFYFLRWEESKVFWAGNRLQFGVD